MELAGDSALAMLSLVTLAVPVAAVGFFEGGYNHMLKDALFSMGASLDTMRRLFPPPTYALPNDLFFEITGVAQLPAGLVTGYFMWRSLRERWAARRRMSVERAGSKD